MTDDEYAAWASDRARLRWFQAVATLEVAAALDRLIELAESTCR